MTLLWKCQSVIESVITDIHIYKISYIFFVGLGGGGHTPQSKIYITFISWKFCILTLHRVKQSQVLFWYLQCTIEIFNYIKGVQAKMCFCTFCFHSISGSEQPIFNILVPILTIMWILLGLIYEFWRLHAQKLRLLKKIDF